MSLLSRILEQTRYTRRGDIVAEALGNHVPFKDAHNSGTKPQALCQYTDNICVSFMVILPQLNTTYLILRKVR